MVFDLDVVQEVGRPEALKVVADDLLDAVVTDLQPEGITERVIVEDIANAIWRKRRAIRADAALNGRKGCLPGSAEQKKMDVLLEYSDQELRWRDLDLLVVISHHSEKVIQYERHLDKRLRGLLSLLVLLQERRRIVDQEPPSANG